MSNAREGVLRWLVERAKQAHSAGLPGYRVRNSIIHVEAKAWLVERGYQSYSAENLTRRFRTIREQDQLRHVGLELTATDISAAETTWTITYRPTLHAATPIVAAPPQTRTTRLQRPPPKKGTDPFARLGQATDS